jgi:tetraacyldisaccharide 4'-kinase
MFMMFRQIYNKGIPLQMIHMKKRIQRIMESSDETRIFSSEFFLYALSFCYSGALRLRRIFYKKNILKPRKLPCFVISIGNITLGGTGKTPMTIYIANMLKDLGFKVVVLTRGYKGKAEKTGGIVSDGTKVLMDPNHAGDEPFMMAATLSKIPVIVGKDRFRAGMIAVRRFHPHVIILDDAFQHLQIVRDINLVLLDHDRPLGNQHVVPRGTMREDISALLSAHAFIFTRSSIKDTPYLKEFKILLKNKPVFKSFHVPYIAKALKKNTRAKRLQIQDQRSFISGSQILKNRKVFAFSGICKNNEFLRTVREFNCQVVGFRGFPDHYKYSVHDLEQLTQSAIKARADVIVTTQKDYVRISHKTTWPTDLVVVGVEIAFNEKQADFSSFLTAELKKTDSGHKT